MRSLLVIVFVTIGASIACSVYKSAGSQPLANENLQAQPSASTSATAAQEKSLCTLTLAGAPDINGIRLGMMPDEVLALFPGSKDDADVRNNLSRPPSQFGVSELSIKPAKYQSR